MVVLTLIQSPSVGTTISSNTAVTLTATDASGNSTSCSFTVVLIDATPPSLTCPGNQTESADANCDATLSDYTSLATASDNCDATPTCNIKVQRREQLFPAIRRLL